jgi:uncharacterized phage infection (PIP) family protein YhgE
MQGQNGYIKHTEVNGNVPNDKGAQHHFVGRVSSIPLIKDSVSTAQAIANKTSIGRFALSTANSTLTKVSQIATNNQPRYIQDYYQNYVQPHVEKVDAFGCRSLDAIQQKVPSINKPSSEILQDLAGPPYQIMDGVKVRIDSTLQTVAHPAHVVVLEANKKIGFVVDSFEGVVDRYLPSATNSDEGNASDNKKEVNNNQVKRAYGVLNEASRRITQKVTDQVSGIPKSREDLLQLAENSEIIQSLTDKVRLLQEGLAESVKVYSTEAQRRLPDSVNARIQQSTELLSQVTSSINQQVSQLVDYLKSPEVPDWLKQKLQNVVDTTNQQMTFIRTELARGDINYVEKLKHVAGHLQTQILPVLEAFASQFRTYAESIKENTQYELNAPLHYFGLNQKIKTQ